MRRAHLGVDFGTSHTVAVLRRADGRAEPLLFDGSPLLPSCVYAGPSGLVAGADARHAARLDPSRFEPHPKRRVDGGTVLLGDAEYPVAELFAAVLNRVRERCAEVDGTVPAAVTLTHPATWGPLRRAVLRDAAARAGLGDVRFLPEPVAAAAYYAGELRHEVAEGAVVAVHDFGGGTFDACAVRRTRDGFEVLAVDGLDDLGGADLDEALLRHIRDGVGADADWAWFDAPGTAGERRDARILREDVREAKERLSRQAAASVYVPGLAADVHVTREELEALAGPMLARAVDATRAVMREAGVRTAGGGGGVRLAGVFLVGGASRMPLVATLLHRDAGVAPVVADDIEQVVARGAVIEAGERAGQAERVETGGDAGVLPGDATPDSPTAPPASPQAGHAGHAGAGAYAGPQPGAARPAPAAAPGGLPGPYSPPGAQAREPVPAEQPGTPPADRARPATPAPGAVPAPAPQPLTPTARARVLLFLTLAAQLALAVAVWTNGEFQGIARNTLGFVPYWAAGGVITASLCLAAVRRTAAQVAALAAQAAVLLVMLAYGYRTNQWLRWYEHDDDPVRLGVFLLIALAAAALLLLAGEPVGAWFANGRPYPWLGPPWIRRTAVAVLLALVFVLQRDYLVFA